MDDVERAQTHAVVEERRREPGEAKEPEDAVQLAHAGQRRAAARADVRPAKPLGDTFAADAADAHSVERLDRVEAAMAAETGHFVAPVLRPPCRAARARVAREL